MMGKSLKVAYVYQSINTNFAEPFAVQLHIYHQIHGLQQAGHKADLVSLQGRRVLCTGDLLVFRAAEPPEHSFGRLGLSGSGLFKLMESAARRIQNSLKLPYLALFDSYRTYDACVKNLRGYDVIHERYNLMAVGGAMASRRLGIPYVLEVNSDLLEERQAQGKPERGLRRWFAVKTMRYCLDTAQRVICVSAQLKEHLVNKWRVDRDKIVVLPNAADTETFGKQYDVRSVRSRLGLLDEPVIMFVGGFYLWHDLGLLVESFGDVLAKVPNARLVLVGDGRTKPLVKQLVDEMGLGHAVRMTGPVEHSQVPEMLAVASVAVAPNISFFDGHGGSPLKLYEYMAAGKAIVATRTGQVTEIIEDNCNGILVEAGNRAELADAMLSLLNDTRSRERIGAEARRRAVEHHSWSQYVRRLEQIYQSSNQ